MNRKQSQFAYLLFLPFLILLPACTPEVTILKPDVKLPDQFSPELKAKESDENQSESGSIKWKEYFTDKHLVALIDQALKNNQELNIFIQEVLISKNEIGAKQGAYLPSVELGADAGIDKVGEYTRNGVVEENHDIEEGKRFPEPLPEFTFGAFAKWEVDIWHKLRDAEKSAVARYLASIEGRNFIVTNLIAEIANSYYELLALDSQLQIVKRNIGIQSDALEVVKYEKHSARVTDLALRRFEAQLFKTKSLQFEIKQNIVETENKINFLVGRYPQHIERTTDVFNNIMPPTIAAGVPSHLLKNRPDIRQAELELEAAGLDIDVTRANFYPTLRITGGFGYSAYDTARLIESPESMIYSIAGGLTAPFLNRMDIEAMYRNASAKQVQSVINYEQTVLQAFIEVSNQLSNIDNLQKNYDLRSKQVNALERSVQISTRLFNSARADYTEVLLTQREAMDSKFELVETKSRQLRATVSVYRALGGGWVS